MRPLRLELEGFTAFRDRVEIDFAGADLFALVGATGAGKSSVIDAMVFALYGSVPRLDLRAVEPVISAGRAEARVRFDFTVAETPYTAVRIVRRTKSGATTKEARLESGEEVIAGDARAMSEAAERILGLGFEQFTKCVVLPQGAFARFLHDKPRDRQDLLVRLLELGVFERMRAAARGRREAAAQQAEWLQRQLHDLADATPEALRAAEQRVTALEELREAIDEAQPRLDALRADEAKATEEREQAAEHAALLGALTVPDDVAELTDQAAAAEQAARATDEALRAAEQEVELAETALAALPERDRLVRLAALHEACAKLEGRRERGEPIVAQRRDEAETAAKAAGRATEQAARMETALAEARRAHAAHDLAAHLEPGGSCPVCQQAVDAPPRRTAPPALADAEAALDRARAEERDRAAALQAAREALAKAEQTLGDIEAELTDVRSRLAGEPDASTVERHLAAVNTARADLERARERAVAAREAARSAADRAQQAAARRDGAWRSFDETRDRVAALGPPAADRSDLAASWKGLAAWAVEERARRLAAGERADRARTEAADARAALVAELTQRCAGAGVQVEGRPPRDACVETLVAATSERDGIAAAIEQAAKLRDEHRARTEEAAVAGTLTKHLDARGFERWLLDEALEQLCAGATDVLRELSGGQYSLEVDGQHNFAVVDHRNADERRSARTLSGGETFLASLALALTLGEHLRELAVGATPQLESMFLDEGFGTLDPETLDVVASTVEELGAGGRTVGLVTHVRDLADRMPVRFEVRRGPGGSTVERQEV